MQLFRWLKAGGSEERRRLVGRKLKDEQPAKGDFRGSYGFGRRAHRPDPKAHYGFDNEARRAPDSEAP